MPTPTPLPDMGEGWHVLNQNVFERGGDLFVAGEIYNQTEDTIWIGSVQITFQSDQGSLTVEAPVEVALLPPRRKIAFFSNAGPMVYDEYTIDLLYVSLPGFPSTDLGVAGDGFDRVNGAYRVQGQVENLGAELDDYALVVATLFDGQGRVAGVSSVEIAADDLLPGQPAPFEVLVNRYGPEVAGYEVQAFGF